MGQDVIEDRDLARRGGQKEVAAAKFPVVVIIAPTDDCSATHFGQFGRGQVSSTRSPKLKITLLDIQAFEEGPRCEESRGSFVIS